MKEITFRKEFVKKAEGLLGMATGNNRGHMRVDRDTDGVMVFYEHKTKGILTMGASSKRGWEGFEEAFMDALRNGYFLSK